MIPEAKHVFRKTIPYKPLLQPLTLLMACILFVALILIIGLMDLGRLDRTLAGLMQNRGTDIAGNIQRQAQEHLSSLVPVTREDRGDVMAPLSEISFLPQEALINSLVSLMRNVDRNWGSGQLKGDEQKRFPTEKGLWLLGILDSKGNAVFQNRRIPGQITDKSAAVIAGKQEIVIELFGSVSSEKIGFIALRRSAGSGTIIAALNRDGFRYWGMQVAVQNAVDTEAPAGISYIRIVGPNGIVLGSSGEAPGAPELESGWAKPSVSSRKISVRNKDIQEVICPFYLDGKMEGIGRIGLERGAADQILNENRNHMIISMIFIIVIGVLSIWFLYQNQNRHLAKMEELSERLQQSEKLSSLGQLAAGVAHEIRNPLNAISMASQRLQREYTPRAEKNGEDFSRLTSVIRDEIRRLNSIIEEFLAFSRSQKLELRDYPVQELLKKLVRLIEEESRSRGISITLNCKNGSAPVPMDVDKLQQAFFNIVKNAMESISGKGAIDITVESITEDQVRVRISDTGAGLSREEIKKIFNPEYTTKEKGLGLGLSIAHEIIRSHRGEIRVKSEPGQGTTFEIDLPATG